MKSFKEIKSYDTITINHNNDEINNAFSTVMGDIINFYLPLQEGVLKKYDSMMKNGETINIISYTYFKNNEDDDTFDLEFYIFYKHTYEFCHLASIQVINIDFVNNSPNHEYTLKYYNNKSYDSETIARHNINNLITKFLKVMCYVILIKDNKEIIYKKVSEPKSTKTNSIAKSNYKRNNVEVLNKNKVVYSLNIKTDSYRQFKKSYIRHTESWQVMGFARHYKSGKVTYVKPHIRGNKKKETDKKEYIVK